MTITVTVRGNKFIYFLDKISKRVDEFLHRYGERGSTSARIFSKFAKFRYIGSGRTTKIGFEVNVCSVADLTAAERSLTQYASLPCSIAPRDSGAPGN